MQFSVLYSSPVMQERIHFIIHFSSDLHLQLGRLLKESKQIISLCLQSGFSWH